MAEKKVYNLKAIAVANLNAQKANMRIELGDLDARMEPLGSKILTPKLTIKGSPFDHTEDLRILGLKSKSDVASAKAQADFSEKLNEGYELMGDGLTMVIIGDESLKILADAGVEFPGADQFIPRTAKPARNAASAKPVLA